MAGMDWLKESTSIALRAIHLSSHHSSFYVEPSGPGKKLRVYISQHFKKNPPGVIPNKLQRTANMDIVETNTDPAHNHERQHRHLVAALAISRRCCRRDVHYDREGS